MSELAKLTNIGGALEEQLHQVGIDTPKQLTEIGSKEAWLRIQKIDASACYNRLCALEGAIQGIRWHSLSDQDKLDLKDFYHIHTTANYRD